MRVTHGTVRQFAIITDDTWLLGEKVSRRFAFGANWARFVRKLDEKAVEAATDALRELLDLETLSGRSFVDVGSGSGLSSLAAFRLGAERIYSFDYDHLSVECTSEVKSRFAADAGDRWVVRRGDCLDDEYVTSIGQFDVVYSWGVLHHTGDMWRALENVVALVGDGGLISIALYNDQGCRSKIWWFVKRLYNSSRVGKMAVVLAYFPVHVVLSAAIDLSRLRNPVARYVTRRKRGMSELRDISDWLGGFPFEVASPEKVMAFFARRGFLPVKTELVGSGMGCNEFTLVRKNGAGDIK